MSSKLGNGMVLLMESAKTVKARRSMRRERVPGKAFSSTFASEIFRKAESPMGDILRKTAYLSVMTERAAERLLDQEMGAAYFLGWRGKILQGPTGMVRRGQGRAAQECFVFLQVILLFSQQGSRFLRN